MLQVELGLHFKDGRSDFFKRIDSVFYGPYELTLSIANSNEGVVPGFSKLKEYVFSNTLKKVKHDAILIKGDIEAEVRQIKKGSGKDIWLFGGASLIASMLNLGLVDEISLAVHPIILGDGKPLFGQMANRTLLTLKDTKTYLSGLVLLTYSLT